MSTAATTSQPANSSNVTKLTKQTANNNKKETTPDELPKSSKDDDTCDDWEQLDQIQIKKSLQSIKLSSEKNDDETILINAPTTTNTANTLNQSIPFTFMMQNANSSFPQPSIKILKRPPSDKKLNEMASQNANNTAQPIKTFKQREQEYAEARLRILGSAHPEDEDPTAAAASSMPSSNISSNNNNPNNLNTTANSNKSVQKSINNSSVKSYGANNNNSGYYSPSFTTNPNINMQINSNTNNSYLLNQNFENNSNYPNQPKNFNNNNFSNNIPNNNNNNYNKPQPINLIREPIVPDGTRGFRGNAGFDNQNDHGRNFSSSNAKQ